MDLSLPCLRQCENENAKTHLTFPFERLALLYGSKYSKLYLYAKMENYRGQLRLNINTVTLFP